MLLCFSFVVHAELTEEQELGRRLYNDQNLSVNHNQSCASCHSLKKIDGKAAAFVDPANVKQGTPVSLGSIDYATGALNTPSAAYAAFSPPFHWDEKEALYEGGLFWNGRAGDLAEQAEKPLLNPVEMAMPNQWAVVSRLKENNAYVKAFAQLYQFDLDAIPHIKDAQFQQPTPKAVGDIYP